MLRGIRVITNLKPYSAYKDSGVSWLGESGSLELSHSNAGADKCECPTRDYTCDYEFQYIDIGTVGTGFLIRKPQQMQFGGAPSVQTDSS